MNDLEQLKNAFDALSPELKEQMKEYVCGNAGGSGRTSLDGATHGVTGDQAGFMAMSLGADASPGEIWAARAKSAKADFARGFTHTKTRTPRTSH